MRRCSTYPLIRNDEASTGFGSGAPRSATPYSVSIPQILGTATASAYRRPLQILTGCDPLDLTSTAGLVVLRHDRADVDDALALLARDLRPVVGVRGVGQVLVLAELLLDRIEQVLRPDPAGTTGDR